MTAAAIAAERWPQWLIAHEDHALTEQEQIAVFALVGYLHTEQSDYPQNAAAAPDAVEIFREKIVNQGLYTAMVRAGEGGGDAARLYLGID